MNLVRQSCVIVVDIFRVARKDRDLRTADARLKQYEIEMSELKARNEALAYDVNRKTDDATVRRILIVTLTIDSDDETNVTRRCFRLSTANG
jgi:site-specific recombinase